jgi:hypothetical protein
MDPLWGPAMDSMDSLLDPLLTPYGPQAREKLARRRERQQERTRVEEREQRVTQEITAAGLDGLIAGLPL